MVQENHRQSRQTCIRNEQMPTWSSSTRMEDPRKDQINFEEPKKRNRPKKLPSHYLPTDDVEHFNNTNKRKRLTIN